MDSNAKLFLKKLIHAIIITFSFIFLATLGYKILYPDVSYLRILFATIITVTTVGFEDVLSVSSNNISLIYTIFVLLIGLGLVLYCVSVFTAIMIEGYMHSVFAERNSKRRAKKMKGHSIVCGVGTTSFHVVERLYKEGQQFVVIENNQENISKIQKSFKNITLLVGDATTEELLNEANISEAATLVASLSNDRDNLYLTITAKMMNPKIQIIARAIDYNLQDKFKKAGANYVISPNFLGGQRIAARIVNPNIEEFLEVIIKQDADKTINLYHICIPENSELIGKTLKESKISQTTGVNIISYSPDGNTEDYIFNPSAELEIRPKSMLLFIGSIEQKRMLEEMAGIV